MKQSESLQKQFIYRGYPRGQVERVKQRATERDRDLSFTVALDYTPLAQQIKRIICDHWHLVSNIPVCNRFPKTQAIKDILVHVDIKKENRHISPS